MNALWAWAALEAAAQEHVRSTSGLILTKRDTIGELRATAVAYADACRATLREVEPIDAHVSFEETWATTGYQYGHDALEQVRLGWNLAREALAGARGVLRDAEDSAENTKAPRRSCDTVDLEIAEAELVEAAEDIDRKTGASPSDLQYLRAAALRYAIAEIEAGFTDGSLSDILGHLDMVAAREIAG
ncbi:MAG: hypothetical protein ACTHU0_00200 [Kofleriaceae bacterium]